MVTTGPYKAKASSLLHIFLHPNPSDPQQSPTPQAGSQGLYLAHTFFFLTTLQKHPLLHPTPSLASHLSSPLPSSSELHAQALPQAWKDSSLCGLEDSCLSFQNQPESLFPCRVSVPHPKAHVDPPPGSNLLPVVELSNKVRSLFTIHLAAGLKAPESRTLYQSPLYPQRGRSVNISGLKCLLHRGS